MLRRVSSAFLGLVRSPSTESAPNPESSTPPSPVNGSSSATPTPPPQSRPFLLSRRLSSFWTSGRVFSSAPASPSPLKDESIASNLPHVLVPGSLEIDRDGVLRITLGAPHLQERESPAAQQGESGSPVPVSEGASTTSLSYHQTLRSDKAISTLIKNLEFTFSCSDNELLKQEVEEWAKTLSIGDFNQVETIHISLPPPTPEPLEDDQAMDDENPQDDVSKLEPASAHKGSSFVDISALLESIAPMESLTALSLEKVDICEERAAAALAGTKTLTNLTILACPQRVLGSLLTYLPELSEVSIVLKEGDDALNCTSMLVPLKSTLKSISVKVPGQKVPVLEFISAFEGAPLAKIAIDFSEGEDDTTTQLREAFPLYAETLDKAEEECKEPTKSDNNTDSEITPTKLDAEIAMDIDGEVAMQTRISLSPVVSPSGKVLSRVAMLEMKKEELRLSEKISKDKASKVVVSLSRKIGPSKR